MAQVNPETMFLQYQNMIRKAAHRFHRCNPCIDYDDSGTIDSNENYYWNGDQQKGQNA